MTPEEVAERWPEAVAMARAYRDVFGAEMRLIYARNARSEELGRPEALTGQPVKSTRK